MAQKWIVGKRIQIAGSGTDKSDVSKLSYAHSLVRKIVTEFLENGGGFVVTIGEEPFIKTGELAKTFDWTILEMVNCHKKSRKWPSAQGAPVIAVGFENYEERIPTNRKALWNKLIADGKVELQIIPSEVTFGGIMRQTQSKFGDLLLTIGGSIGVYHLAQVYQASKKTIIPLNLSLNNSETSASEALSKHVIKDCKDFFEYQPVNEALTAYSRLSIKNENKEIEQFVDILTSFINHLPPPTAFYVRLLNKKLPEFNVVEGYFRNVVDPVITKLGYRRFEMETDYSDEPFMNIELFTKLHFSSLVIADLSGIRPNCFLEMGYALGLGKKVIMTAVEGTKLPWDTETIHCHFWSSDMTDEDRRNALRQFLEKNMNKEALVER
ncbi:MAG: hypothetical protein ACFCUE_02750 [Candidatus Bathyarchaeia archaeon]|jgi:hypothetical protein